MARTGIRGGQIQDETIESEDLASGSIKAGELSQQAISSQTLITTTDTTNDRVLIWDATDSSLKQVAPTNLGLGAATPAGSDTAVQFNDGGSSFGGDSGLTFNKTTNALTVTGPVTASHIDVGEYITHTGDSDTFIQFSDDEINLQAGAKQMIKLSQAGTNKIILNNGQADVDLQVKSKGNANVFRTDAFNNSVYFGGNGASGADNNFWVSGSIGSKDSSTRGTAVFGGDVVVSGTLRVSDAFSLPRSDGDLNQVLLTDGDGSVIWGDQGGPPSKLERAVSKPTATFSADPTAYSVFAVDCNGGDVTATLPTPSSPNEGLQATFIKNAGTNTLTITAGNLNIWDQGTAITNYEITDHGRNVTLICISYAWVVIAEA